MSNHEPAQKMLPHHLERKAVVYIRQSSMQQVRQNQESQRLQYALVDLAKAFCFRRVEVIDCDLGVSAASGGSERQGFKQLLMSVAMGDVGIIFSQGSRCVGSGSDRTHLVEVPGLWQHPSDLPVVS